MDIDVTQSQEGSLALAPSHTNNGRGNEQDEMLTQIDYQPHYDAHEQYIHKGGLSLLLYLLQSILMLQSLLSNFRAFPERLSISYNFMFCQHSSTLGTTRKDSEFLDLVSISFPISSHSYRKRVIDHHRYL